MFINVVPLNLVNEPLYYHSPTNHSLKIGLNQWRIQKGVPPPPKIFKKCCRKSLFTTVITEYICSNGIAMQKTL